jgi:hypothetical protein
MQRAGSFAWSKTTGTGSGQGSRRKTPTNGVAWGWHGVGMGLAWGWHIIGVGMGLAWGWHGVGMGSHGVGMGLAWGWHGVGMGLAWGWHGVGMERMGPHGDEPTGPQKRRQDFVAEAGASRKSVGSWGLSVGT